MSIATEAWVIFLLIGLVAGFLASIVVGGGGLIGCLLSGVIGAFVGGYLFNALGISLGIDNALVVQIGSRGHDEISFDELIARPLWRGTVVLHGQQFCG